MPETCVGAALSLVFLHGLFGVREGTILAAASVGPFVRVIGKLLPNFESLVPTQTRVKGTGTLTQ